MGILANHVPSIEQLRPGVVDIVEESSGNKQFFGMLWGMEICGKLEPVLMME